MAEHPRRIPGESIGMRLSQRWDRRPRMGTSPAFFARFGLADPWLPEDAEWEAPTDGRFSYLSAAPFYARLRRLAWARRRRQQRLARYATSGHARLRAATRQWPGEAVRPSSLGGSPVFGGSSAFSMPDLVLPTPQQAQLEPQPEQGSTSSGGQRRRTGPTAAVANPWLITPWTGARVFRAEARAPNDEAAPIREVVVVRETSGTGPARVIERVRPSTEWPSTGEVSRGAAATRPMDRLGARAERSLSASSPIQQAIESAASRTVSRRAVAALSGLARVVENLPPAEQVVEIRRVLRRVGAAASTVRTEIEDVLPEAPSSTAVARSRASLAQGSSVGSRGLRPTLAGSPMVEALLAPPRPQVIEVPAVGSSSARRAASRSEQAVPARLSSNPVARPVAAVASSAASEPLLSASPVARVLRARRLQAQAPLAARPMAVSLAGVQTRPMQAVAPSTTTLSSESGDSAPRAAGHAGPASSASIVRSRRSAQARPETVETGSEQVATRSAASSAILVRTRSGAITTRAAAARRNLALDLESGAQGGVAARSAGRSASLTADKGDVPSAEPELPLSATASVAARLFAAAPHSVEPGPVDLIEGQPFVGARTSRAQQRAVAPAVRADGVYVSAPMAAPQTMATAAEGQVLRPDAGQPMTSAAASRADAPPAATAPTASRRTLAAQTPAPVAAARMAPATVHAAARAERAEDSSESLVPAVSPGSRAARASEGRPWRGSAIVRTPVGTFVPASTLLASRDERVASPAEEPAARPGAVARASATQVAHAEERQARTTPTSTAKVVRSSATPVASEEGRASSVRHAAARIVRAEAPVGEEPARSVLPAAVPALSRRRPVPEAVVVQAPPAASSEPADRATARAVRAVRRVVASVQAYSRVERTPVVGRSAAEALRPQAIVAGDVDPGLLGRDARGPVSYVRTLSRTPDRVIVVSVPAPTEPSAEQVRSSRPRGERSSPVAPAGQPLDWVGARLAHTQGRPFHGASSFRTPTGGYDPSQGWTTPGGEYDPMGVHTTAARPYRPARTTVTPAGQVVPARWSAGPRRVAGTPDAVALRGAQPQDVAEAVEPQARTRQPSFNQTMGAVDSGVVSRDMPGWAQRSTGQPLVRHSGDIVTALAKASQPEEIVQIIQERGESFRASDLPAPILQVIEQIRSASAEPASEAIRNESVESVASSATTVRTRAHRSRSTARVLRGFTPLRKGGSASSTGGVGANNIMKLAQRLKGLIHLAEAQRKDAARAQVRMAAQEAPSVDGGAVAREGGDDQGDSQADISALSSEVLEAVSQRLQERQELAVGDSEGKKHGGWW